MRKILAPFACAVLAGCAAASAAPEAPAAAPAPTPQQIVAARQSAFHLSAATFGGMRATVESGGDVKPLAFAARGLARWARAMPAMFPQGTRLAESRALPALWANRADFETKAAAFAAAADALATAAQSGDRTAFADAYKAVGASCSACHDAYRAEAPR